MPGILRGLGYHTLQIGMRHYADAEDAHPLGGFDAANYRWSRFDDLQVSAAARDETQVFQAAVAERLSDRLGQMFGFKRFVSTFEHVQGRTVSPYWSDARRVETLVQSFATAAEPWFVHRTCWTRTAVRIVRAISISLAIREQPLATVSRRKRMKTSGSHRSTRGCGTPRAHRRCIQLRSHVGVDYDRTGAADDQVPQDAS